MLSSYKCDNRQSVRAGTYLHLSSSIISQFVVILSTSKCTAVLFNSLLKYNPVVTTPIIPSNIGICAYYINLSDVFLESSVLDMELFEWAKSTLYSGVEVAARYPIGQALLYQADNVLWVVEKTAQWAIPPTNDGDQSSSKRKELIRPLPWIFFLWLLVVMRLSREALSILALIRGRPPIRPANVVTYIQGRRRFLRSLKYQGMRSMRSKSTQGIPRNENIYNKIKALMVYTMCFRKAEAHYNNNNSALSQRADDKVMVVRRSKKRREDHRQGYAHDSDDSCENAMEKFLDKMDHLNDDSAIDDSDYTIKNAESVKSDTSVTSDEETNSTLTDISSHNTASSTPQKETSADKSRGKTNLSQSNTEDTLLSYNKNNSNSTEKNVSLNTATMEVLASERNGHIELQNKDKDDIKSEAPSINNKSLSPRKASPHKLANGSSVRDEPRSTETKEIPIRQNSDIPLLKIIPADEATNEQNQGVEGSYNKNRKKHKSNTSLEANINTKVKSSPTNSIANPTPQGKIGKAKSPQKKSNLRGPFWKRRKNSGSS